MCEPEPTSSKALKIWCYHHGHSGPEGIVEEARRSGLMWLEELKLKHDGRRGVTYQEPSSCKTESINKENRLKQTAAAQ